MHRHRSVMGPIASLAVSAALVVAVGMTPALALADEAQEAQGQDGAVTLQDESALGDGEGLSTSVVPRADLSLTDGVPDSQPAELADADDGEGVAVEASERILPSASAAPDDQCADASDEDDWQVAEPEGQEPPAVPEGEPPAVAGQDCSPADGVCQAGAPVEGPDVMAGADERTLGTDAVAQPEDADEGLQATPAADVTMTTAASGPDRQATSAADAAACTPEADGGEDADGSAANVTAPKDGWLVADDGLTYYYKDGEPYTGWVVDDHLAEYGTRRYWVGRGGLLATSRVVNPSEGSGAYWAYARPEGFVVVGSYATQDVRGNDVVYLANKAGRLPTKGGWLVGKAYGQGRQRYYLQKEASGAYAARVGYSTRGYAHYTRPEGYVVRGAWATKDAKGNKVVVLASSKGRLPTKGGWTTSSAYGQGKRLYYLQKDKASGAYVSRVGYSTKGYPHYTTKEGFVLQGTKKMGGCLYLANAETGRMPVLARGSSGKRPSRGWVWSKVPDGSKRLYYLYRLDSGAYVAKAGYSKDGYPHYTTKRGPVLLGARRVGKAVYLAALKDGRMPAKAGWKTTDAYGQGKRRYYFVRLKSGACVAKVGMSTKGGRHFTTKRGYVFNTGMKRFGKTWYMASSSGRLRKTTPPDIRSYLKSSLAHGSKGVAYQRYIVMHDTEGGSNGWNIVNGWVAGGAYVAAHFVVNRDGSIVQCVPMDQIAHHAGFGDTGHNAYYGISESSRDDRRGTTPIGRWASDYGMNAWSIGIEMIHVGNQSYPSAQLKAVDKLIAYIDGHYGFESKIIDHKMWRSYNSDTSPAFARYLANLRATRTCDGRGR